MHADMHLIICILTVYLIMHADMYLTMHIDYACNSDILTMYISLLTIGMKIKKRLIYLVWGLLLMLLAQKNIEPVFKVL